MRVCVDICMLVGEANQYITNYRGHQVIDFNDLLQMLPNKKTPGTKQ